VALTQVAGVGVRELAGVLRDARHGAESTAPIFLSGILTPELERALGSSAAATGAIRSGGDPGGALALVVVLGGAPTTEDDERMRIAARALVPVVAVQTDPRSKTALPYVPHSAVVVCPPGHGFPVDEIARVLAQELGGDAVSLAARLPALRNGIVRELVRRASLRAAVVGALPWRRGADFPMLALIQARLVLDVAAAHGSAIDRERAPELAAVAGAGLGARSLARRLPARLPFVGAATGYLVTRAVGEAVARRFAAAPQ
jgi:uncharacterized protein (DUF697 family)